MNIVIDQLKTKLNIPPKGLGSTSLESGELDEAYVTAEEGWQSSDNCYLTATDEYAEEQTVTTQKRKRTRRRKRKK